MIAGDASSFVGVVSLPSCVHSKYVTKRAWVVSGLGDDYYIAAEYYWCLFIESLSRGEISFTKFDERMIPPKRPTQPVTVWKREHSRE